MTVNYPEKAPANREEFLSFIEDNLLAIKFIAAQNYMNRLGNISFLLIAEKFEKAARKYGPSWQGLYGIDAFAEGMEEKLDDVVYTGWELLQEHFSSTHQ